MEIMRYKMFDRDTQIGEFIEDWSDMVHGVRLSIILKPDLDLDNYRYWNLRVLQSGRVIDDRGVRFWIDERCTTSTQDGIERKLKLWGMSEYDQLTIMHQSSAINLMDSVWVQFNPVATFDRNHPNGSHFEKILPMITSQCAPV